MQSNWITQPCAIPNEATRTAARIRQGLLTKPTGALGKLEALAVQLAALQGVETPHIERVHISIFAADHGVAAEGVSLFPQAVTAEMVRNFARGGAAISVLARQLHATLEVINLGTVSEVESLPQVSDERIAAATANFTQTAAMTAAQCTTALLSGHAAVARAAAAQLFIGGEMGIANTTAATALACALLQSSPTQLAGAGTGLDSDGIAHKVRVIQRALALHEAVVAEQEVLAILRCFGGFEIAGLTGAYIAAAQQGIPVLVDGFISSVAALIAVRLNPAVRDWLLFAHTSAEQGHQIVLAALHAEPLLQLGLRLGEGSGAALAIPLLQLACALHNNMATFAEAGVSES